MLWHRRFKRLFGALFLAFVRCMMAPPSPCRTLQGAFWASGSPLHPLVERSEILFWPRLTPSLIAPSPPPDFEALSWPRLVAPLATCQTSRHFLGLDSSSLSPLARLRGTFLASIHRTSRRLPDFEALSWPRLIEPLATRQTSRHFLGLDSSHLSPLARLRGTFLASTHRPSRH